MTLRFETVIEEQRPGFTRSSVYVVDDRIIIDEPDVGVLWYCDHCARGFAVTAQFACGDHHITLCRECLHLAINGIDLRVAKPRSA
jgi:hypothetical protein